MVTSPRLRGQRVPLQPKSRIDQAGPISEGVDKNVQDVKTRDNQLRPDLARQQSANGTRDKEDRKGARLAISRLFLAAPVGRCPEELCPEEVCGGHQTDYAVVYRSRLPCPVPPTSHILPCLVSVSRSVFRMARVAQGEVRKHTNTVCAAFWAALL